MAATIHTECARARSLRGRPLRCARDVGRTSRGSSVSLRSRSSTRSRRPSADVDLRGSKADSQCFGIGLAADGDASATDFVSGILGDAVDDFAGGLFDAGLVFDVGEPVIAEEVDEASDAQATAALAAALAVKDTVATAAAIAWPQASLQTSAAQRSTPSTDYEDAVSLASEDSDNETDDELEAFAFAKMSGNFAKAAMMKGLTRAVDEVIGAQDSSEEDDPQTTADVTIVEASRVALLGAIEGAVDEAVDDNDAIEDEDNMQQWEEQEDSDHEIEFLGEGFLCGEDLAFDYTSSILGGAFEQASATWCVGEAEGEPMEDAMQVWVEGPGCSEDFAFDYTSSLLDAAFSQTARTSKTDQDTEEQNTQEVTSNAAAVQMRDQEDADSEIGKAEDSMDTKSGELIAKFRKAFGQALHSGQLSTVFSAVVEQDKFSSLRSKVQSSFKEGLASGSLACALQEMATERRSTLAEETVPLPSPPPVESPAPPDTGSPFVYSARPSPSTPSRTRRRIIGGVVRAPATKLDFGEPDASPIEAAESSMPKKRHSKSSKKQGRETPKAFRLDQGSDADEPVGGSAWTRSSSITRGYETLGAQFHIIAAPEDGGEVPIYERPHSKASARLRAASASAMSMDLELGGSKPAQSPHASMRQAFTPQSLGFDRKMGSSRSLGSLQTPKVTKGKLSGGLLPSLVSEKTSTETIAWSLHMSKAGTRRYSAGLHSSASVIF